MAILQGARTVETSMAASHAYLDPPVSRAGLAVAKAVRITVHCTLFTV